tara:strand:+ start:105 stop:611 length:507 start_codon:yes stop_codon:yes gene_type:complete
MHLSIGDKILFKKDSQKGSIVKINSSNKFTVLTSDGFEVTVSKNDLVKIAPNSEGISSYGANFNTKDHAISQTKPIRKSKKSNTLKIDLHIELLSDNYAFMDNFEIVQIQISHCYSAIEKALNTNVYKLEIIHGIGEGILRKEVHSILRKYNLRFYLTKDGGSTEAFL